MSDDALRRIHERSLAQSAADPSRAGCLEPERIADLVDGSVPEAERMTMLAHISGCAHCLREFEMLRSLEAASEEMAPAQWWNNQVFLRAAVILLMVGGGAYAVNDFMARRAGIERGGTEHIALITPRGPVSFAASKTFVWRPVAGAASYRVEVLDGLGAVRYSTVTADTMQMMPDSVRLDSGVTYQWWVRARIRGNGEERSRMQTFDVQQP